MNNIINIANFDICIKEYRGNRVVTFSDIDNVHGRKSGTANKRFLDNKEHFINGEDYFSVSNSEIRKSQLLQLSDNDFSNKTLITEQGYLLLVKSFTDDLAWGVQRKLVNNYFRTEENSKPRSAIELLELEFQAIREVESKVENVNQDLQEFKLDMPLLAVECEKITYAVRKKGIELMSGKSSSAYKDSSIRGKVYRDIHDQLKREFGVSTYKAIKRGQCDKAIEIIRAHKLPFVIEYDIIAVNAQGVIGGIA